MASDNKSPFQSKTGGKPISLLQLQRYLMNDLASQERESLEKEIIKNPDLAAYVLELESSRSTLEWPDIHHQISQPNSVANQESFLTRFGNRLTNLLPNPTPARLSLAAAFAVVFLILPSLLLKLQPESGFRAKGNSHQEIILHVGGHKMAAGQKRHVNSGEIITFSYRSSRSIFAQIWYKEDAGTPNHFDGSNENSLHWPASSSWESPPQRIRLEGDWKIQRVLILAAPEKITGDEARKIITGEEKPKKGIEIFTYDLLQP